MNDTTCEFCGGQIGAGWRMSRVGAACARKHRERCENATDAERVYWLQHGAWPRAPKVRRAS